MFTSLFASAGGVAFLISAPVLGIAGIYFGAYAAHSLLVVIEQTAAGFDRVHWPQETFFDWVGKLVYLLGIVLLVLLPAGILLSLLAVEGSPNSPVLFALLCFLLLWLVLPIALLSSLSSSSRLHLIRWEIIKGLARAWPSLLLFYGVTGVLEFLALGGLYFGVFGWKEVQLAVTPPGMVSMIGLASLVIGLPVAAVLSATGLLWYARLLGRLGWMLHIVEPHMEQDEPEPAEEQAETPNESPAPSAPAEPLPLAIGAPNVSTGETYALADDPPPNPPPDPPPFRWQSGRMPSAAPPRSQWRDRPEGRQPVPDLREEKPEPYVGAGVAAMLEPKIAFFPWYRTSLWAWVTLIFGILSLAFIARLPVG